MSDSNDEIERPKNQSVAQVIYADNRVSWEGIVKKNWTRSILRLTFLRKIIQPNLTWHSLT
jgi:hypothetical protein